MAPSAGHLHKLVVKNVKLLKSVAPFYSPFGADITYRAAWKSTQHLIESRFPVTLRRTGDLRLVPVRVRADQPLHPVAYLRQNKGRWYTTHSALNAAARRFSTTANGTTPGLKYDRTLFPKSRTSTAVNALTGRAPFASSLRPNLTGGTLGRTAGGYSLGSGRIGGARYFSHTPSAPAQVIQNVSQAVRAFCVSGHKAQFDGFDQQTGRKRFRAVSTHHDMVTRTVSSLPKATPGSYVDFRVNPTITALTPLSAVTGYTTDSSSKEQNINSSGLLDVLSVDFSRSLKELATILNDLKCLTELGDLPITYTASSASLRVHFPGCDAESVERLCQEIGVKRGIVVQDEDFDTFAGTEIALLFPFASSKTPSDVDGLFEMEDRRHAKKYLADPIEWQTMLSPSYSEHYEDNMDHDLSVQSDMGLEPFEEMNPWAGDVSAYPEGYESLSEASSLEHTTSSPLEYQDFEGIQRFIQMCDGVRR